MAKTISIDVSHVYHSRGEDMSVKDALAWVERNMSTENEEGESTGPAYSPADLIVYGVRRLMALHKDGKRYASGKLATRLYTPRLDNVEHAPKGLAPHAEAIDAIGEKLHPTPAKPERKPRKATKVSAPKAPKAAKPAPADKPATKATKVSAPKGGATVAF